MASVVKCTLSLLDMCPTSSASSTGIRPSSHFDGLGPALDTFLSGIRAVQGTATVVRGASGFRQVHHLSAVASGIGRFPVRMDAPFVLVVLVRLGTVTLRRAVFLIRVSLREKQQQQN